MVALLATSALTVTGAGAADAEYAQQPRTTWEPDGVVYDIAVGGDRVYIGGAFTSLRSPDTGEQVSRPGVAAFDRATGQLVRGFSASTNATVRAVAVSADGSKVFVGGTFTAVNGTARRGLAALDRSGALVAGWKAAVAGADPTAPAGVRDLETSRGALFVAGKFRRVGGRARRNLAKVDVATGAVSGWRANATKGVANALSVSADGSRLFVGGNFNRIAGVTHDFLASLSTADGQASAWNPDMVCDTCSVIDLVERNGVVYAAMGGGGGRLAAYPIGAERWSWLDSADGNVQAVDYHDGLVYAGGHFGSRFGGRTASQFAVVEAATGRVLDSPTFDGNNLPGVWAVEAGPEFLRVGGGFHGPRPQAHYAEFPTVAPPNAAPFARDTTARTNYETAVSITLQAGDPDGDALSYSYTRPDHGTVTGGGATVVYTPDDGFSGTDSFRFTVTDPRGAADSATVTVTVSQRPDVTVTAAAVRFTDSCGTADDRYTVPSSDGVVYEIAGKVRDAGTYPGAGTVSVRASAKAGYQLTGESSWRHAYTDEACPRVSRLRVLLDGGRPVLSWRMPADDDYAHVLVRRRVGVHAPATRRGGVKVYSGDARRVTDRVRAGRTYSYSIWTVDEHGHVSNTRRSTTIRALRTPALSAPRQTIRTERGLPFRVRWGWAGDPDDTRYRVHWRRPGAAWHTWRAATRAHSAVFGRNGHPVRVRQGNDFRFRVVAMDPWGHRTRARLDRSHVAKDDRRGRISGGFERAHAPNQWRGTVTRTSTRGARIRFVGRGNVWTVFGQRMPRGSRFAVYSGKNLVGTYTSRGPTRRVRAILWRHTFPSGQRRTITVVNLGSPGHPRLVIDGFDAVFR